MKKIKNLKKKIKSEIKLINSEIDVLIQTLKETPNASKLRTKLTFKRGQLIMLVDVLDMIKATNKDDRITSEKLLSIGFERVDVSAEESGDNQYHYYVYPNNDDTLLITNADDECIDDSYTIEYFKMMKIGKITKFSDLKKLIKLIKRFK